MFYLYILYYAVYVFYGKVRVTVSDFSGNGIPLLPNYLIHHVIK